MVSFIPAISKVYNKLYITLKKTYLKSNRKMYVKFYDKDITNTFSCPENL